MIIQWKSMEIVQKYWPKLAKSLTGNNQILARCVVEVLSHRGGKHHQRQPMNTKHFTIGTDPHIKIAHSEQLFQRIIDAILHDAVLEKVHILERSHCRELLLVLKCLVVLLLKFLMLLIFLMSSNS